MSVLVGFLMFCLGLALGRSELDKRLDQFE
jgi:hypothetical protein